MKVSHKFAVARSPQFGEGPQGLKPSVLADFSARLKPCPAERLATRIVAVVEAVRNYPHLGRAGVKPGIRELVIGGTPYIVVYQVQGKRVTICTILHGAQQKEP